MLIRAFNSQKKLALVMTDLDTNSVLRKTEAGVNAIKLRDRSLTPKSRMLLIVVDGHKSVGELTKAMPNPEEARQLLSELLGAGFVETIAAAPPPAPPATTAATHAVPMRSGGTEEELKLKIRRATRLLDAILGPDSDTLSLQVERCKTHEQFNSKVIEISRIIGAMRNEKKGADFLVAATADTS